MAKYRKKPVVIEAMQWKDGFLQDENSMIYVSDWVPKVVFSINYVNGDPAYGEMELYLKTLEGLMKVSEGDYVIKGIQGEYYACKPDIFEATYEEVKE